MSENQGCLAFILRLFGGGAKEPGPLPYRLRDDFLSPAELAFYRVLATTVAGRAAILTKVNLADIFFVARPNENVGYRNRISGKHVDFLLCDANDLRPRVGIELDDASHQRPRRQDRDRFVDQVFEVAGLPLVRVPLRSGYSVVELTAVLTPHLGGEAPAATGGAVDALDDVPAVNADVGVAPVCPKCGVPMVVRTAARGERRGERFYGCPNYPRCKEIRAVA
jgi:hypothetical protein